AFLPTTGCGLSLWASPLLTPVSCPVARRPIAVIAAVSSGRAAQASPSSPRRAAQTACSAWEWIVIPGRTGRAGRMDRPRRAGRPAGPVRLRRRRGGLPGGLRGRLPGRLLDELPLDEDLHVVADDEPPVGQHVEAHPEVLAVNRDFGAVADAVAH